MNRLRRYQERRLQRERDQAEAKARAYNESAAASQAQAERDLPNLHRIGWRVTDAANFRILDDQIGRALEWERRDAYEQGYRAGLGNRDAR